MSAEDSDIKKWVDICLLAAGGGQLCDFLNTFAENIGEEIGDFNWNYIFETEKANIELVFEKNAYFDVKNWWKSTKIVTIHNIDPEVNKLCLRRLSCNRWIFS
jgi:hypothetical protein